MSSATQRLTDEIQRTQEGEHQRLVLLSSLLAQISKRVLEARLVLMVLSHTGSQEILRCIVASDEEDGAIANVLGRVRMILLDVSWAAWHVADYGARDDKPHDPLRGWSLGYIAWYDRSTIAMLEAMFNNDVDRDPDGLWSIAEPLVASLIESLWDFHLEAKSAQEHIDSLVTALSVQPMPASTPNASAPKKPLKVSSPKHSGKAAEKAAA